MATNVFIENYVKNLFEKELGEAIPIAPLTPFILRPDPFDFDTKRRKDFPLPSEFVKPITPEIDGVDGVDGVSGGDSSDDPPPDISDLEFIEGGIDSYIIDDEPKNLNNSWQDKVANYFDEKFGMPMGVELASGQVRSTGAGGALDQVIGLVPFGALMSGFATEANIENLNKIAANAALEKEGFGIARLNGITVGVKPDAAILQGMAEMGLTTSQQRKLREKISGKSGALGSAYQSYTSGEGMFETGKTYSAGEAGYRDTVLSAQLPDDLKAQLLGFDPNPNFAFSPGRLQSQFGVKTPQNYVQGVSFVDYAANKKAAEKNRAGDTEDGSFTDVSTPSMGLETDIDAQQSQVNPIGINLGIDMDNISGVPTGINITPSPQPPAPTIAPDPFYNDSDDGNNNNSSADSSSMGDSGFGGGGGYSTAYGGRINKAYGGGENTGFTSKTPNKITIQGVGLIKPEETFLKTDTVRDRYDLEARENDFIINGPASEQFKKPILSFINQAETNLKNKGVDISVGKPTIPISKQVPLLVASSENYIPKEYIEAFNPSNPEEGYRILEAMNNVGKPEVTRLKSQIDEPTDQSKYQAYEGMRVGDQRQGFLFGRPKLNLTGPNINKTESGGTFVPGISDEPVEMNLDQQRYFGDYEFGDIKKAIKRTEIQGFEKDPYIFTGVKAKKGEASSAFGPMQITAKTLEDFKNRSLEYSSLDKNEKSYIEALLAQGEDKINLELYKTLKRGPKEKRVNVTASNFYKGKERGLKPYGKGVINPNLHKKYYDKIADRVLMHKLGDHETIEKALASYGEGANYSQKVLNDLLDIMQGTEPPTKVISK